MWTVAEGVKYVTQVHFDDRDSGEITMDFWGFCG